MHNGGGGGGIKAIQGQPIQGRHYSDDNELDHSGKVTWEEPTHHNAGRASHQYVSSFHLVLMLILVLCIDVVTRKARARANHPLTIRNLGRTRTPLSTRTSTMQYVSTSFALHCQATTTEYPRRFIRNKLNAYRIVVTSDCYLCVLCIISTAYRIYIGETMYSYCTNGNPRCALYGKANKNKSIS